MAENKKGFILYCDLIHTIEQLPNDKAGELFKHILRYVNDQNPITDDLITNITFEPIKQQLKRDLRQWEDSASQKSISGKLGNLKRWNNDLYIQVLDKIITIEDAEVIANSRKVSHPDKVQSHNVAKIAVTDTVTVTDKVIKENNRDAAKAATLKRISDFKESLYPYCKPRGIYDKETVKVFFEYWSELNKSQTKMLWELKPTFEISKRLATWIKNEDKFTINGKAEKTNNHVY